MLRYLKSKIPAAHHDARQRERAEYFAFEKTLHHGFPAKPSCQSYCENLNLLAIGTKNGLIYILGAPGVEFVGEQPNKTPIVDLFFIPNQGRVISLCEDQTLHLWEVNFRDGKSFLDHVTCCSTEDRLKKISSCALRSVADADGEVSHCLLIGTESGNVYSLDTKSFELTDYIIYQDVIIQNIPDDFKVNPGAVESIAVQHSDSNQILLAYNRGLVVLWDATASNARQTFVSTQGIETVSWHSGGSKLVSGHNDGSYVVWSVEDAAKPMHSPNIPFGPFPCKPIDKIIWSNTDADDDDLLIFTGGMPRASFGDRNTVAVQRKGKEVVLDLSSRVLDITTFGEQNQQTLLILCEEELVAVDLGSADWPLFRLPYLQPLHASPITACQHVASVTDSLLEQLRQFGEEQVNGKQAYSKREWPICGGTVLENDNSLGKELLVTGHEDGSVKLWLLDGVTLELVYVLNSARVFHGYVDPTANQEVEEWPPFRKVGLYDPYTDDARYSVQRVHFEDGQLLVGGTAGQVILFEFNTEEKSVQLEQKEIQIVTDTENFVWKGEAKLEVRDEAITHSAGFAPKCLLQMNPPASVTALAAKNDWGIIAAGTAHGFALYDTVKNETILSKCLLNPNDLLSQVVNAAAEGTISRFKSFKKSLRASFRKRRRHHDDESPAKTPQSPQSPAKAEKTEEKKEDEPGTSAEEPQKPEPETAEPVPEKKEEEQPVAAAASPKKESPKKESPKKKKEEEEEVQPVERAVEARGDNRDNAGLSSLVRSIYFAKTYLVDGDNLSATVWVGTNGGEIHIHLLTVPDADKRQEEAVSATLAKEIRLMHGAPVLHINVVDSRGIALEECDEEKAAAHGQKVVIVSEEQIKTFQLPSLKPGRHKYKLTAVEGSRVRKAHFVNVKNVNDNTKVEPFIVLMTNTGEIQTFSVQTLRRYLHEECIKSTDITAILSTVLTKNGDGFYLSSSSEWQRFAVAASHVVRNNCSVELPEGARPPVKEEEKEEEKKEEDKKEESPKEGDAVAAADTSAVSGEQNSTLPTDVTIDDIRDYTQKEETTTEIVDGVTTVTKVIKTTKTISSADGDKTEITTDIQKLVNGEAEEELARLKTMKIEDAEVAEEAVN